MERAEVLAALAAVDFVVIFDEATPRELIARLLPDVLAKGGDWASDQIVGRAEVEAAGGKVVSIPLEPAPSTTELFEEFVPWLRVKRSPLPTDAVPSRDRATRPRGASSRRRRQPGTAAPRLDAGNHRGTDRSMQGAPGGHRGQRDCGVPFYGWWTPSDAPKSCSSRCAFSAARWAVRPHPPRCCRHSTNSPAGEWDRTRKFWKRAPPRSLVT